MSNVKWQMNFKIPAFAEAASRRQASVKQFSAAFRLSFEIWI
jgi:hypothetical protein